MEIVRSLFENRIGESFSLQDEGNRQITLILTEVSESDERIKQQAQQLGTRESFSLLFHGPMEPFLRQHIYTLQHLELGPLELFLVPVNQDGNGYFYEAVFN